MKQLKKLISSIIALSMLLGIAAIPQVFAADPSGDVIKSDGDQTKKADIIYSYLGTSPASQDVTSGLPSTWVSYTSGLEGLSNKDGIVWEEGGLVWIGITMKNMSKLSTMLNSRQKDDNSNAGISLLTLSLAYDTDFFEAPKNSRNSCTLMTSSNYPKTMLTPDRTPVYTFGVTTTTYETQMSAQSSVSLKPLTLTQQDKSKIAINMYNASTTSISTFDPLLFMDYYDPDNNFAEVTAPDEVMLFSAPLKMKGSTPPPAGTKVIEGFFDAVGTILVVGNSNDSVSFVYSIDENSAGTNGDTNIINRFNISALVDIFPESNDNYPYVINELSLKTADGNALDSAPANTGFIVNTKFTKVQPRDETDYIFVEVYDTNGSLLSLDYLQGKFTENETYNIGFYIPPQKENIGSIKASICNNFDNRTPLAEPKEL